MTPRLPKHLHDALTAAQHALAFVHGIGLDVYLQDVLIRSAVERQLEILGEACRRALDEDADLRRRVPDVVFAVGLRNRIIHGYDGIDSAVVLDTVQRDLPAMIVGLQNELAACLPPP